MRPTPAESERELLLTVARVLRALIDDTTRGADDHLYLKALDAAIKRVGASEESSLIPGSRPDGGMLYPEDDSSRPACRVVGDAAS